MRNLHHDGIAGIQYEYYSCECYLSLSNFIHRSCSFAIIFDGRLDKNNRNSLDSGS